jgi:hypothetical protein
MSFTENDRKFNHLEIMNSLKIIYTPTYVYIGLYIVYVQMYTHTYIHAYLENVWHALHVELKVFMEKINTQ